jgi:hypothetical protein
MKRIVAIGGLAAIVALVILNLVGIARYPGGPLRESKDGGVLWLDAWPSEWGGNVTSNSAAADWASTNGDLVFSTGLPADDWPWPAQVERITPIGAEGDLVMREALLLQPARSWVGTISGFGPLTADQQALLDGNFAPLPGTIASGVPRQQLVAVVRGSHPGPAAFAGFVIDYRVGPFTFRSVLHDALHACLGATAAERDCPETP